MMKHASGSPCVRGFTCDSVHRRFLLERRARAPSTAAAITSATPSRAPIRTTTPTTIRTTRRRGAITRTTSTPTTIRTATRTCTRRRRAVRARPHRGPDDGQQRARAARQGAPRRQRRRRRGACRARSDQGADEDAADAEQRHRRLRSGQPRQRQLPVHDAPGVGVRQALRLEAGGAAGLVERQLLAGRRPARSRSASSPGGDVARSASTAARCPRPTRRWRAAGRC